MNKLQTMRLNAGLSQSQLAKKTGIKLRTIRAYEHEEYELRNASYGKVVALAKALRCNPEDII